MSATRLALSSASSSNVKFTVYPDAGPAAWTRTYENPELYDWFLQHRRQPAPRAPAAR